MKASLCTNQIFFPAWDFRLLEKILNLHPSTVSIYLSHFSYELWNRAQVREEGSEAILHKKISDYGKDDNNNDKNDYNDNDWTILVKIPMTVSCHFFFFFGNIKDLSGNNYKNDNYNE